MRLQWLVLDGFGIGAMPDVRLTRENDANADTIGSLNRWVKEHKHRTLDLPTLSALGLGMLRPDLELKLGWFDACCRAYRCALGYPGADTFAGHQTMMGVDMSHVVVCPLASHIDVVRAQLVNSGYSVELLADNRMLMIDGCALVHDNLEADPGLNWNVSARLQDMSWDDLRSIAVDVRRVAPVARVIAVGGYSDRPLVDSVKEGGDGTFGLDTPASGFYKNGGLQVEHLGIDIDHGRQLPELAAASGLGVSLIGKAADILETDHEVCRLPNVETDLIMADFLEQSRIQDVVITNVQQTDLAGHQQDPERYVEVLEMADAFLSEWVREMVPGDRLVVVADHGNDPLVGHGKHTREYVPVLAARVTGHAEESARMTCANLKSLADVGASAAKVLGLEDGRIGHGDAVEALWMPDPQQVDS